MSTFTALAATTIRDHLEADEVRRASLDTWIGESDALLDALELLNADDFTLLPKRAQTLLADLTLRLFTLGGHPKSFADFRCAGSLHPDRRDSQVQRAVDYMLDQLQARAFVLKWPGLADFLAEEDESA